MNLHDFKKSVYSALVFFGTLVILSAAYAAYQIINSSEYTSGTPLTSTLFGKVVSNLTDLNSRLSNAETNGGIVPSGAIMAFNLTTCPTGWSPLDGTGGRPDLRGQFLRGMNTFDSGATTRSDGKQDPDCAGRIGGCVLGSTQTDELKSHYHKTYRNADYAAGGAYYGNYISSGLTGMESPQNMTSTGGTETRPKNVMVLFCSKN